MNMIVLTPVETNYKLNLTVPNKPKTKSFLLANDTNVQVWKNLIYMMKNIPWRKNICISMLDCIMIRGKLSEKQEKLISTMFINDMMTTADDIEQYRSNQVRLYLLGNVHGGKYFSNSLIWDLERQVREWGILSFKQQAVVNKNWDQYKRTIKRDLLSNPEIIRSLISQFGENYVHYT